MPETQPKRRHRIEYKELGWLRRRMVRGNPKSHDKAFMRETMDEHGYTVPVLFDEKTGKIPAGHGRLDELERRRKAGGDPPAGVEARGGRWWVPTIMGVKFKDERQMRRYLLADNQGTMLGGWNGKLLAAALSKFEKPDFVGTGFTGDDLVRFMAMSGGAAGAGKTDPNAIPKRVPTIAKKGDLFILGKHRLLCGDATNPKDVARLVNDPKDQVAVLMNTDAPYGVDYIAVKGLQGAWQDDIENDNIDAKKLREMLDKVLKHAPLSAKPAIYMWHPSGELNEVFRAAMVARGILVYRQIVWTKPNFVMTRSGMYHWSHETAFYGWLQGKLPAWYGPKDQRSVWPIGKDDGKSLHPTQKPVELFEIPMRNHTAPGSVCYEPFSGSGSQIIAGERLRRRVYAMDISPRWVDVAVARWEAFSGGKATLER